MNPVAFSIFGLEIRWYGILIASGICFGLLVAIYTCRVKGVIYDKLLDILFVALPMGIIGARLYYVLFNLEYYKTFWDVINIREGGLAIHGGIILGVLSAYIYTRLKELDFLAYLDAAAPSIILAQGIGRWGNFFNQEAHGGVVSKEFISHFPQFIQRGMLIDNFYYHPTFLYESLWDIAVFVVLLILLNKTRKNGLVFFTYIGLYSIGRFLIESLRTDSLLFGSLRAAQLVSLIGIVLWISYIIISLRRKS